MEGTKLFESVNYYVVESNVKNLAEVKQALKEGGASREFYMSELVTHVISDVPVDSQTLSFESQDHVIVHSDWVVMSQKCGALLPTDAFDSSGGKLFSDLVFCPSKLGVSDVEKLCVLLMFHGAKMQRRLDQKVTHLVTTEMSGAKYECAQKHANIRVVTPDWILDSVDAGMRLEEERYHPSCLKRVMENESKETAAAEACNGNILSSEMLTSGQPAHEHLNAVVKSREMEGTEPNPPTAPSGVDGKGSPNHMTSTHPVTRSSAIPTETVKTGRGGEEERKADSVPTKSEQLLSGVVIYFTDYQDCVEDDTLEKWKMVVVEHGGEVLDRYDSKKCTHLLALHKKSPVFSQAMAEGKCIASAHWLNDVLTEQKMFPPRNPIHFPTAFKWQLPNAEQYSMTLTNYMEDERELVKDMLRICGIPYTGHLSRSNTHLICKRPEGKKYEKALEWGVQVVNSTFLADTIHNGQLPSTVFPRYTVLGHPDEFHADKSFEPSRILELWKPFLKAYSQLHPELILEGSLAPPARPNQEDRLPVGGKRERPGDLSPESTLKDKMRRLVHGKTRSPPVILFTGISTSVVKNLKQIVTRLGGTYTECARDCSHIVTPRVARTIKFLSGISVCDCVVTPKWVEESGKKGAFVSEEDYFLRDSDAEQLFGMDLVTSLSRAKEKKLLAGVGVYATAGVQPPPASLGEILGCAGGEVLSLEQARCILAGGTAQGTEIKSVLILSTPVDIGNGLCSEFTAKNIKVYNAELILIGVLKQSLDYGQYAFILD